MAVDSTALCSLAQVKSYLNKSDTADDTAIETIINAGSKEIENDLDRTFSSTTHTEYYSGNQQRAGSQKLFLRNWPITSITSIYNDANDPPTFGADSLEDSSYYSYDDSEIPGMVYFYQSTLNPGFKNIKITYVAGYSRGTSPGASNDALPDDLQQAAARHFARMWKDQTAGKAGRVSKSGGGGGSVEFLQDKYEPDVWRVLVHYIRWDV